MEITISWIGGILMLFMLACIPVWNIARLWCLLKCCKVKHCKNQQCKFKGCCSKWEEVCTQEEIAELYRLLEEYRAEM